MKSIDLNADVGEFTDEESEHREALLIPFVTSINVACGGHAGDDFSMRKSLLLAQKYGVSVGAHPSFPDRVHFGRIMMTYTTEQIREWIRSQVLQLIEIAEELGMQLRHVKPHGALYHVTANDEQAAAAFCDALEIDRTLMIYTLPESTLERIAIGRGFNVVREGFADRNYENSGQLSPRTFGEAAMIVDAELGAQQALFLAQGNPIRARTGEMIHITVQSICIHGDGAHALDFVKQIRSKLVGAGINIQSPFE